MAIKDAIRVVIPDPKNSRDAEVQASYQISRFIRNAFAHSPFNPIWSIDADCQGQVFEVKGIIKFDTATLNGTPFDWRHYGGPLALFRLSRFVRAAILGENPKIRTLIPIQKKVYYQQGTLVIGQLPESKDTT